MRKLAGTLFMVAFAAAALTACGTAGDDDMVGREVTNPVQVDEYGRDRDTMLPNTTDRLHDNNTLNRDID